MALRPILVNRNWLSNLWGFLHTREDWYGRVNLNNVIGFQRLIEEEIKPSFERLSFRQQRRLKETFRYALTQFDDKELIDAYDSRLLPLNRPDGDIRDFYVRIWRAMFGDEDFVHIDPEQYVEVGGYSDSMWD